jgi:hypothetical protein
MHGVLACWPPMVGHASRSQPAMGPIQTRCKDTVQNYPNQQVHAHLPGSKKDNQRQQQQQQQEQPNSVDEGQWPPPAHTVGELHPR